MWDNEIMLISELVEVASYSGVVVHLVLALSFHD